MEFAACKGMSPSAPGAEDIFFPGQGRSDQSDRAKKVCAQCPVAAECERYRERLGARDGVWAGRIHTHGGKKRTDRQ